MLVVAVAATILRNLFKKPEDPADEERRRRFQLNQVGRIVEGLVVEVVETPAPPPPPPPPPPGVPSAEPTRPQSQASGTQSSPSGEVKNV